MLDYMLELNNLLNVVTADTPARGRGLRGRKRKWEQVCRRAVKMSWTDEYLTKSSMNINTRDADTSTRSIGKLNGSYFVFVLHVN